MFDSRDSKLTQFNAVLRPGIVRILRWLSIRLIVNIQCGCGSICHSSCRSRSRGICLRGWMVLWRRLGIGWSRRVWSRVGSRCSSGWLVVHRLGGSGSVPGHGQGRGHDHREAGRSIRNVISNAIGIVATNTPIVSTSSGRRTQVYVTHGSQVFFPNPTSCRLATLLDSFNNISCFPLGILSLLNNLCHNKQNNVI